MIIAAAVIAAVLTWAVVLTRKDRRHGNDERRANLTRAVERCVRARRLRIEAVQSDEAGAYGADEAAAG